MRGKVVLPHLEEWRRVIDGPTDGIIELADIGG